MLYVIGLDRFVYYCFFINPKLISTRNFPLYNCLQSKSKSSKKMHIDSSYQSLFCLALVVFYC